ncbi:MAG TPA: DUF4142 domain-containing protein [Gemmatimonadaceae bacterium]|nr:DUF4142 domain-containing protein [Gemmatimonadaceae bacterium]
MGVHRPTHITASAVLAACITLAACEGKEASAKSADMQAKAGDSTSAAASAATGSAALTDANIVALLDAASMADSTLAFEALGLVTSKDAKSYAKMMMGEHHALREKGQKVANKASISAQMPSEDPFRAAVDGERTDMTLAPKGHAIDSTYIAHEIAVHTAVISWASSAEAQAQNKELKELIKSAAPVLKKHLDRALEIQRKLAM